MFPFGETAKQSVSQKGIFCYVRFIGLHSLYNHHVQRPCSIRNSSRKRKSGYPNRLAGNSYLDVQRYIRDNRLFSDQVRKYIRTYEEAKYYMDNGYREVNWFGNSALIIDIDLDYFSKKHNATNRKLIAAGRSPVVPSYEDQTFDLHHVGQKKDSPLAIIPSGIHNGQKTYSIFHSGHSSDEDLHNTAFDLQRQKFWLVYVQQNDEYGGYHKIPYVNRKKQ